MDFASVSQTRRLKSHSVRRSWLADVFAIGALIALTALVVWNFLSFPIWLSRTDILTQFLPWYAFVADQLKAWNIPGWNPHQLSGFSIAGDPQSGWTYLPAMVPFLFFAPVTAFKVLVVFQLVFAGITTYTLARVLGMHPPASLIAAAAFEFGPFLFRDTYCCTAEVQMGTWIPLSLLGVELAVRSRSWLGRAASWSVAGLGLSQMVASFVGQGSYNGFILVGTYTVYRTLLSPPIGSPRPIIRIRQMIVHGTAIFVVGLGLGAAGLLPRLDVNRRTNVAGGAYENVQRLPSTGWTSDQLIIHFVGYTGKTLNENRQFYLGGATIVLALLAPIVARRRYGTPYYVALAVVVMILSLKPTPIHQILFILPGYRSLHLHATTRVIQVMLIAPAILAGATVDSFMRWRWRPWAIPALFLPLLFIVSVRNDPQLGRSIGNAPVKIAAITTVILLAGACLELLRARRDFPGGMALSYLIPILLLGVVFWEPTGREILDTYRYEPDHPQLLQAIDVNASSTDPGGAGEFLQQQQLSVEPFRYFGYDGKNLRTKRRSGQTYHENRRYPEIQSLLVNARSVRLGLYDIQGYDPLKLQRYVDFVDAINDGVEQNYHDANVLPSGVDSPLLDLLNVRYIIIPYPAKSPSPERTDLAYLEGHHRRVFDNGKVAVLENDNALPRAWIVHDARQAAKRDVLELLTSGAVDPRHTAVLERDPPALEPAGDPGSESVDFTEYQPNRIDVNVRAGGSGIVVFSEVYDEGWHAYVDGQRAPIYEADYTLRAVPVGAGEHRVELRYEPFSLRLGVAISTVFGLGVLVIFGALLFQRLRKAGTQSHRGRHSLQSR